MIQLPMTHAPLSPQSSSAHAQLYVGGVVGGVFGQQHAALSDAQKRMTPVHPEYPAGHVHIFSSPSPSAKAHDATEPATMAARLATARTWVRAARVIMTSSPSASEPGTSEQLRLL